MRGIGRLAVASSSPSSNPTAANIGRQPCFIASSFSTFSGSGSGRGRGRGRGDSSSSVYTPPGRPERGDPDIDDGFIPSPGVGRGRGQPLPSSPVLPSFSKLISSVQPDSGRGRGILPPGESPSNFSKKPIFFRRGNESEGPPELHFSDSSPAPIVPSLPRSLSSNLPGAGRGKVVTSPDSHAPLPVEENRHLRAHSDRGRSVQPRSSTSSPRLSREEAVKKAVGILSRDGGRTGQGGRGRGMRGQRSWRGRGMQARGGRGGRRAGYDRFRDADDDYTSGLYLGDNADGERLAKRLGPEKMNELVEGFEEMSYRVLPSPMDEAYLNALHTNYSIECEPEYLMEDFGTNPDIDEKPPISLRDALEKVKPFLMEYEGIQSQEEWEEVMKETMEKVPVMEELIEMYSGPGRVTAKQQQQELERVANTLPENIPSSVKRFTDRALLSLQSNPGWGFDKKCQFMDKLVWEVSQQYK